MPEGDTIHKVAAAIAPDLVGRRLRAGGVATGTGPALAGREVTIVHALGKHLVIEFADTLVLRVHLGMHGVWHRYRRNQPWLRPRARASLVLDTGEWLLVCFAAAAVEVLRAGGPGLRAWEARLGPDLLDAATDAGTLPTRARLLAEAGTPLADLLLDQRVACGIGNVYKSEVLFLARVAPWCPVGAAPDVLLERLYRQAVVLLRANLGSGRRRTRFPDDGRGDLWVYNRAGRACLACGGEIRFGRLGRHRRVTYWCPACQTPSGKE